MTKEHEESIEDRQKKKHVLDGWTRNEKIERMERQNVYQMEWEKIFLFFYQY